MAAFTRTYQILNGSTWTALASPSTLVSGNVFRVQDSINTGQPSLFVITKQYTCSGTPFIPPANFGALVIPVLHPNGIDTIYFQPS